MPGETLTFDIFANDRASETFRRLGLAADQASGDVRQLGDRLDKLGTRVTTARVALDGNKEANVELDKLDLKLIRLGKRVANPSIDVEGKARALADISAVDLAMDRLNKKFASPSRSSGIGKALISGAALRGLFSRGGGGAAADTAGAAGAGGGGIADFLVSPVGLGAIGGTVAGLLPLIASLTDALAGFGVGAAGAGGAGLLAAKFQPSVLAPGLKNIEQTLSTVTQSFGPSLGLMAVQFGKFVQALAPTLAKLTGATLPFFQSFLSFAEQAAKIALPALIQVMRQMVSSGALKAMTQGFVILVQGLADFIKELGPGFKAGAEVFRAVAIGIKGLLVGLGAAFGWLGKITKTLLTDEHDEWDSFRHDTAVIFDGIRHDIASIWDGIYSDTIGNVIRLVKDVTGWFDKLPPGIRSILSGLGKMLYGIGTGAITDFLHGLESIAGSVLSWVGHFVSTIWDKVKSFFGISSPSALFFDAGKNLMLGLEKGIQSHAHRAASAARAASGVVSGALGGDEAANRALAQRLFPWPKSMWPAFQNLVMAESGFNRFALNPTSGAYGIPQALPMTKLPFAGQPAGGSHAGPQLSWMFDYIAGRYGNPLAAEAHEQAYHWYGSGMSGGIFTQPTLIGVGERGPERVDVTPLVHPSRGTQPIVLEIAPGTESGLTAALMQVIRKQIRLRGGGDVQLALGR